MLDHFALGLSGLAKKSKGKLILCNRALVDKGDANPTNIISLALLLFYIIVMISPLSSLLSEI